jgi:hypothetical protein
MSDTSGWGPPGQGPEPARPGPDAGSGPPPAPGWSAQQPPPAAPPGWDRPGGRGGSDSPPGPGPGAAPSGWEGPGWGHRPPAAKPGIIPLRPLALGEILDGAITCIRTHPGVMLGLSAVVVALSQLVQVPLLYFLLRDVSALATSEVDAGFDEVAAALADSLTALAVGLVVTWLAQLVLTGLLTVVVSRAVLGQQIGAGESWAALRPRLVGLLGLTLVTFLAVVAVVLGGVVPGLVAALAGAPGGLVAALLVVGVLAGGAAGCYVYVVLALAPPALVLEKQGVATAMRRSRRLVTGGWWRVFGVLILALVIATVIAQIVQLPFGLLGGSFSTLGDADAEMGLVPLIVDAVGAVVAGAITYPFNAGVLVLLYVDQRMRREALDLELARAAGVAPEPGTGGLLPPSGTTGGQPASGW